MDENVCRTCRWWAKGLKSPEYGVCKSADVGQYLTGSHSGFSPHESFSCSYYDPSVEWAGDAAEEIDEWYRGVYATLPEDSDERIQKFADIILRHMDTHGVHASNPSSALT